MNISTAANRAGLNESPAISQRRRDFANKCIGSILALPAADVPRQSSLRHLDREIESYLRQLNSGQREVCLLLSAILDVSIKPSHLKDITRLKDQFVEFREAIAMIVKHGEQLASQANAVAVQTRSGMRPSSVASRPGEIADLQAGSSQAALPRSDHQQSQLVSRETTTLARRPRRVITAPLAPEVLEFEAYKRSIAPRSAAQLEVSTSATRTYRGAGVDATVAETLGSRVLRRAQQNRSAPLMPADVMGAHASMLSSLSTGMQPQETPSSSKAPVPSPRHSAAENLVALSQLRLELTPELRGSDDGSAAAQWPQTISPIDASSHRPAQTTQYTGAYDTAFESSDDDELESSDEEQFGSAGVGAERPALGLCVIDGVSVPASLVNPATQAIFVNPVFDKQLGQTIDGPLDAQAELPNHQIADRTLRQVLHAWQTNHSDDAKLVENLRKALTCPFSRALFVQPVIFTDGYTYERSAIVRWITGIQSSSRSTQSFCTDDLVPANVLSNLIGQIDLQVEKGTLTTDKRSSQASSLFLSTLSWGASHGAAPVRYNPPSKKIIEALCHEKAASIGLDFVDLTNRYGETTKRVGSNVRATRVLSTFPLLSTTRDMAKFADALKGTQIHWFYVSWLADCYRMKRDYLTASRLLEENMAANPGNPCIPARFAYSCIFTRQYGSVKEYALQAEDGEETSNFKYAALGEICRLEADFKQALHYFDKSILACKGVKTDVLRQVRIWRKLAERRNNTASCA